MLQRSRVKIPEILLPYFHSYKNSIMRTTQTTTPTADGLVQCMLEVFGAAVFHTEYFFIEQSQSKQTAGSCY